MPTWYRALEVGDAGLLWEYTYLAVHVPPGKPPYPRDILELPAIRRYAEAWGREGDMGWVACDGERVVGAAWIRLLVGENKGFGYVDEESPELAMSLMKEYRGQGIGTGLLERLLESAATFYPGVCLSVDDDNPAKRLYLRAGFMPVELVGSSVTMVKRFLARGKRP
jgi:GNAT superfamily N-acetyltransferase